MLEACAGAGEGGGGSSFFAGNFGKLVARFKLLALKVYRKFVGNLGFFLTSCNSRFTGFRGPRLGGVEPRGNFTQY